LGKASFLATYMYSRSLDTSSGTADASVFAGLSGDQTNQKQAYGPSDFDRTHHLAVRFVQPIPNPHWKIARGNFGSKLFDGYSLTGSGILQTGSPITVTDGGGATYYGTGTSRASYVPGATAKSATLSGSTESRLLKYFDTTQFVTGGTLYGNTARNILRGPTQRVADLGLTKTTAVHDNLNLEFRAQAFNITNTPNFNNPASDIGTSSTFGVITSTAGNPRILQFALKLIY